MIKFEVHSGTKVLYDVELPAAGCQDSKTFVVCTNCTAGAA